MGHSGATLSPVERLQILQAVARVSCESGRHRELTDIARQYGVSLTTVKNLVRSSLSRAVAILAAEDRLLELLEDPAECQLTSTN